MRPTAGLGFKPEHFDEAVTCPSNGCWFEVHAENYMVEGGSRLAMLAALRIAHPLSLHGVGLSLAAAADPDMRHVARLKALVDRFEPFVVSEHLAWSTWRGVHNPSLLPFPRTRSSLDRVVANVMRVQDVLGRSILIENPALYMELDGHEFAETEFLKELVRRCGCGLLIDVNNVYVSANNLGFGAEAYLDAIPGSAIGEIHLAGHSGDAQYGERLLIDTHDSPICEVVWRLYERLIERVGPKPTLIERDENIPAFAELLRERDRAHALLTSQSTREHRRAVHV
ncbi:MAG TPA: DUF692 domain-containing protein [Methylocystis sp.]|jgi:hypothetical protein